MVTAASMVKGGQWSVEEKLMLPAKFDPVADNPFVLLGIHPNKLVQMGFEPARQFAIDFGSFLLRKVLPDSRGGKAPGDSPKNRWIESCLDRLGDVDFAREAWECLKKFKDFENIKHGFHEARSNLEERLGQVAAADLNYRAELTIVKSHRHTRGMKPMTIILRDLLGTVQRTLTISGVNQPSGFKGSLASYVGGLVKEETPSKTNWPAKREVVGVLKLKGLRGSTVARDGAFLRALDELNLTNSSKFCIEDSGKSGVPSTQPKYSLFQPLAALERLIFFKSLDESGNDLTGQLHAIVPQSHRSSMRILLTKTYFGDTPAICFEGVIEKVLPDQSAGRKARRTRALRRPPQKSASLDGKRESTVPKRKDSRPSTSKKATK